MDFDKTKHLADKAIRKRDEERQKLLQLEQEREERVRKEREAEEQRREDERYVQDSHLFPLFSHIVWRYS